MITLADPRHHLLTLPTPLQRLPRLSARLGREGLFIKRDDLMEVALGGNKLRSLEFWLGAALRQGADMLLVAGGALSNQCRLTAAAAAMAGLDCLILHSAEGSAADQQASFLNRVLGAEVRFVGAVDEARRARIASETAEDLRRQGRRPYLIGDPEVGALGYVLAAEELWRQSESGGHGIRHVVLPGSMGPTEAGFIFGNALLGAPFVVHLVSVEYDEAELRRRVGDIYDGLRRHTGLSVPEFGQLDVRYRMMELGGGYGIPTPASEAALIDFARAEGVLLEHTYMAKTAAGFLALAREPPGPAAEGLCLIHTGGTATLFQQFGLFRTVCPQGRTCWLSTPESAKPCGRQRADDPPRRQENGTWTSSHPARGRSTLPWARACPRTRARHWWRHSTPCRPGATTSPRPAKRVASGHSKRWGRRPRRWAGRRRSSISTREQMLGVARMQAQMIDQMMDAWEAQVKSPNAAGAFPNEMMSKLQQMPGFQGFPGFPGMGAGMPGFPGMPQMPGMEAFSGAMGNPMQFWMQMGEQWQKNWAQAMQMWAQNATPPGGGQNRR